MCCQELTTQKMLKRSIYRISKYEFGNGVFKCYTIHSQAGMQKKVETSRIWVAPMYLCKFIFKKFHRHIYINLTTLLKNLNDPSFLLDTLPNHR